MISLARMKTDGRPPISRRKNAKFQRRENEPLVQMAASKVTNKKASNGSAIAQKDSIVRLKHKEEYNNNIENTKAGHSEGNEIKNLKELLIANLELVERQQEVIGSQERQLVDLKRENETVSCLILSIRV